jgi:hypothetical protein
MTKREGNCYATSEAIYHLLGGKEAGWKPMRLDVGEDQNHWFIQHKSGLIIDLTKSQYDFEPDYSEAVGCGFLTKTPSRRARTIMERLVWKGETFDSDRAFSES